jgi:hypothetical protein
MIEIYLNSKCFPKDGTGFVVKLVSKDNLGTYEWDRAIKFPKLPTKVSNYQALIKALEFALNSIKPDFRTSEMKLYVTKDKYILRMFGRANDVWYKEEKTIELNKDMILAARDLLSRFPNLSIIFVEDDTKTSTPNVSECVFKSLEKILIDTIKTGTEYNVKKP